MATKPTQKTDPVVPRPSSSVVLISPQNEVLLLHRVKTSTSFASAHVFPGGNISPLQDGEFCFGKEDPRRHYDAPNYRNAAIRELFEESGILLAKDKQDNNLSGLVRVNDTEREQGRRDIHSNKIGFLEWLRKQHASAEPDIDGLIPFTHWITPANLPKRFTTQMYLYFLPIPKNTATATATAQGLPKDGRQEVQVPTSDGGIEINEARFLPASTWLQKARAGEIMLYPPQYLLLSIVSQFLDQTAASPPPPPQGPKPTPEIMEGEEERQRRRHNLLQFIHADNPPWTDRFICPRNLKLLDDKRSVLALDDPGPELRGSGKKGVLDRVILVRFGKDGPRNVDVCWKKDVLGGAKSAL